MTDRERIQFEAWIADNDYGPGMAYDGPGSEQWAWTAWQFQGVKLRTLEGQLRWIPVSEKLPAQGTVVLLVSEGYSGQIIDTGWLMDDWRFQLERTAPHDELIYLDKEQVSCWMPLPDLPVAALAPQEAPKEKT